MKIYCHPSSTGKSFIAGLELDGRNLFETERFGLTKHEALGALHSDLHWLANEAKRLEIEAQDECDVASR